MEEEEFNDITGSIPLDKSEIEYNTGFAPKGSGDLPVNLTPIEENPLPTKSTIENLTRNVFDKTTFNKTIDTNVQDPSFFDINLATIPDFWTLYDKFFYEIPKEGATNSHRYLAQTSGDYADFERIQEEINALLDEISELRLENVGLRQENANLEILAAEARSARSTESFRVNNPNSPLLDSPA
jgi:hypothetical protein